MRAGITCALLVLLIRRDGRAEPEDEFRPTPIPLNEWREVRGPRGPQRPPPAPAHYWEDALRHSVYLALVRDNIDRLISEGHFDDPAQDVDDRDLWHKVKWAPFDEMDTADPATLGDVAVMAKGRLIEEPGGFRFTADDKFKNKCTNEKCTDGVKALWSVKRVRQRDPEVSPGHYHYELTFSVITAHKKHKKHYEKPARTFTVRESDPERIVEAPRENRYYEPLPVPTQPHTPRPERALWFHRNILPLARNQARQHHSGLDRLFSSLFSDDGDDIPPPRYKPKQYVPQAYQQHSKVGYVGSPSEHQQKKLNPYGPKPHSYKYSRPIPPLPQQPPHPQHHYLDIDAIGVVSNPYIQPPDYRHGPPNKQSKTPRPPVLPTPPNPVLPQKNFTFETTTKLKPNGTEETTQQPENVNAPHKTYNKQKPTVKISYVTDHVRPPVYSAPPGVFVTMDKKPFKPMPPLRLVHSNKYHKTTRPVDFRPSPQVLDIQFSEPDPLFDTAFRPITVNYANSNTTEKAVAVSNSHIRKPDTTTKKPPKKHEIVNAQRVTTTVPEIITAHSIEDDSDAEWTNVLGAFAKTTPMAAEKEKTKAPETTTVPITSSSTTTSTAVPTTTVRKRITTTTTTEAPTTTPKPKKRTRPPPKFAKSEKVKKHKRITTTTTEVPEKPKERDLTPQASSAAATAKISSSTSTSTTSTSTTTTTTITPAQSTPEHKTTPTTTEQPTTTTTRSQPTSTPESEYTKRQNRFRQSTLKYRSTSERNDRKGEKARTILPPTGIPPRRKGSKFQDQIPSSTPKNTDKQYDSQGRESHIVSPYKSRTTTTESTTTEKVNSTKPTTPAYEEVADRIYITSASPEYSMGQEDDFDENTEENDENEQESKEYSEYVPSTIAMSTPSEKTNEITEENEDEPLEVTDEVTVAPTTTPKNKPKCKKKLNNLNNITVEQRLESVEPEITKPGTSTVSMTTTTTEKPVTPDIFEEIFGGFTFDDSAAESHNNSTTAKPELEQQESTNQEKFIKAEEDFEDFFEAFDDKDRHTDEKFEDQYEYDDKEPVLDDNESLFRSEKDQRSPRQSREEEAYDDYEEPPYSLLELMAME